MGLYQFLSPLYGGVRLLLRPDIRGKEHIPPAGAAIVAGNHIHALDPILVGACTSRQLHSLAKSELHRGLLGCFFRAVGTIPVDLHSASNKAASSAALDKLGQGALIGISPEAKRNYTDQLLLPFKFGAVSLAQKAGCPIVPYAIRGRYRLWSPDLRILFGEPVWVGNMDLEQANKLLYSKVEALLRQLQAEEQSKRQGSPARRGSIQ